MITQADYARFVDDLCEGRRIACRAMVRSFLDHEEQVGTVRDLYELFRDALYEIGRRWETGVASVANEHMATAIIEDLLAIALPHALSQPPRDQRAVISCAADEYHQIGGRIVADTLETHGWDVTFVGAGVSDEVLLALVRQRAPHLVGISITIPGHLAAGMRAVESIRADGGQMPIVVGGYAIAGLPAAWLAGQTGVYACASLNALEELLPRWERG